MRPLFIALLTLLPLTTAFGIDNEVVGEPSVDCEDTMLALTFKTKKPFSGRVYVQGLSDDEKCSHSFVENRNQSRFSMIVPNGDCTMQRHRLSGKVQGLMFSLTIIVSFHGTFVTKADRAYRCMCFFRNAKRVTQSIQMEGLGTTEILDTAPMPTCGYSIHAGSPEGPPVVFGAVGEDIFHVWRCEGGENRRMLVHSCHVTDGRGERFDLLDSSGCAIDPIIQPDVEYNHDTNMAVARTFGYKFSDTNVLNYECIIELCRVDTGECRGMTPPVCANEAIRSRRETIETQIPRSVRSLRDNNVIDEERERIEVGASINMLDTLERDAMAAEIGLDEEEEGERAILLSSRTRPSPLCLPPMTAAAAMAAVVFLGTMSILLSCHLARRRYHYEFTQ